MQILSLIRKTYEVKDDKKKGKSPYTRRHNDSLSEREASYSSITIINTFFLTIAPKTEKLIFK